MSALDAVLVFLTVVLTNLVTFLVIRQDAYEQGYSACWWEQRELQRGLQRALESAERES